MLASQAVKMSLSASESSSFCSFFDEQIHFWLFTSDTSQTWVSEGIVLVKLAVFSLSNSTFSSL